MKRYTADAAKRTGRSESAVQKSVQRGATLGVQLQSIWTEPELWNLPSGAKEAVGSPQQLRRRVARLEPHVQGALPASGLSAGASAATNRWSAA